jgi:hypothetical protein
MSLCVGDRDLTVEERRAAGQARKRLDQRGKFPSPIKGVAGADDNPLPCHRRHRAIAVELDLMQPFIAGGRRVDEGGELRLYEGGKLERGKL